MIQARFPEKRFIQLNTIESLRNKKPLLLSSDRFFDVDLCKCDAFDIFRSLYLLVSM